MFGTLVAVFARMENIQQVLFSNLILCDEIIDVEESNFDGKYITCKTQNFYILLAFLLITITLLILLVFTVTWLNIE